MSTHTTVAIDAEGRGHRELNEKVRKTLACGDSDIVLKNVCGQRYIGAGLRGNAKIAIEGIPGNDLACFMDGADIKVGGNVQDGVANTMSSGSIMVHGHAGDVLAYAMRGGRLFVRGNAGYRVGIHMKQYKDRVPVVIIGGAAKDYFGEYMAGGMLVLLGLGRSEGEPLVGDFLGVGMHGGEIYLLGSVEKWRLGREVGEVVIDDESWARLRRHLDDFASEFGLDPNRFARADFTKLVPVSHRPYGKIYVY